MIGMAHCQMAGQLIGDNDIDNGFDPYWDDVVVLCNFRTSVGSSVFFDEKSQTNFSVDGSHTPVITGSYGAGNYRSGYFDGSTIECIYIDKGTWCTDTTPMTIEFFYRPTDYPSNLYNKYYLMGVHNGDYLEDQNIHYLNDGRFVAQSLSGITITSTNSFPPNNTYYIKVTFDGSTVRLYVNDILEASGVSSSFWLGGDKPFALGWSFVYSGEYSVNAKGYFDNFRITKAVRPSGFGVVPTKSFPTK